MPDDKMGICTKSIENTSEFNSDISSTNNNDSLGLFFNIKESIRVDTVRSTGDIIIGGNGRSTTDGNHDLLRFHLVLCSILLGDFDSVGIDKFGPSIMIVYVLLVQVALADHQLMSISVNQSLLDTVQSLDVGISLGLEGVPVERVDHLVGNLVVAETVCNSFSDMVGSVRTVPHDLCVKSAWGDLDGRYR